MNQLYSFWKVGLVVTFLLQQVSAYIRVVDTNEQFSSRLDSQIGPKLKLGEPYPARLQELARNPYLCSGKDAGEHWNITVPSDGTPVALLARKGVCSFEEKAKYASLYIHPSDVVKYIIVDGDPKKDEDPDVLDSPEATFLSGEKPHETSGAGALVPTELSRSLRKKAHGETLVSVVHVTYPVGSNLRKIVRNEPSKALSEGGMLVEIVGHSRGNEIRRTLLIIWFGLIGISSLIMCLCLMNCIAATFEEEEPEQPPRRRRRKRLTRRQVRAMMPVGTFDGETLIFHARLDRDTPPENESDGDCEHAAPSQPNPEPQSLEACTICLDDYEIGDRVRCLPCDHAFHSRCITKWLTERSATCPLCKTDYYESEDEEEADPTLPSNPPELVAETPLSTSWNSVPPEATTAPSTPASPPIESIPANTETSEQQLHRAGRLFGMWGRRLFRRGTGQEETPPANPLEEPLLPASGTSAGAASSDDNREQEGAADPIEEAQGAEEP